MLTTLDNLNTKSVYSNLSNWAREFKSQQKPWNRMKIYPSPIHKIPVNPLKKLSGNKEITGNSFYVYTKNTRIFVSGTDETNDYICIQISNILCSGNILKNSFHISFQWYPDSHSINRIIDWEYDENEMGDIVYEVKKDKPNTYNVDYNTVIQYITKVCRPPSRKESKIYKLLYFNLSFIDDLLLIIMDFFHPHVI